MQQGFLNSDPWANWLGQRQAQEFYNQQLLLQQQFRNAQNVPVPPSVSSTPGNQGPVNQGQGFGMSYGVGQNETVTQVTRLLSQLNQAELQAVFQSVGQPSQGFVPRDLGDLYEKSGNLPGWGIEKSSKDESSKDMFSRNEKWIGTPPVANHKTWKSREDEVLGWSAYLQELSSWAAQGSVKFGREIEQSSRWLEPIRWSKLSGEQQNRAVRLCALLRAAFIDHGRISLMIEGYQEGLDVLPEATGSDPADAFGNRNGFELLTQLSREFSLRNRAEGLSLKTQLMSRVFSPDVNNGGSHVSDVIRQIDVACARYMRMVGALPLEFQVGLQIQNSDQLSLLVRSLPNDARSYALMHSPGETYQQYRMAARRFENQHRLFKDLVPRRGVVNLVEDFQGSGIPNEDTQEIEGEGETEHVAGLNQTQGPRCLKCGSKKHDSGSCTTDMSKLRCFKCNQLGHASLNCKVKRTPDGKSNAPKENGKNSQKGGSSGKGSKGSGKGKKGKMFAVLDDEGNWWYTDATGGDEAAPDAPQDGANDDTAQGVLVLNCVLPRNSPLVDVDMPRLLNCCSSDVSL